MPAEQAFVAHALKDYIRWYDNALPAPFCDQLVQGFEQMSQEHVQNGKGVRGGLDQSRWTELNMSRFADPAMKGFFLTQIDAALARYNAEVRLGLPIPPSSKISDLVIKRYAAADGDQFQPHFDSIYDRADRYMVLLWYLNDVESGGETRFTDLGIDVQARRGRMLMFPPFWMYQHAGLPPRSGDKYILSTYLLFERNPAAERAPD